MTVPAGDAVAITGIGCRLPDAETPTELWENLAAGRESITIESGSGGGVRARGRLRSMDRFDAEFFDIPAPDAALLDPQHRLLLEVAWEALEDSGYPFDGSPGTVAVYATAGVSGYLPPGAGDQPADRFLGYLSNIPDTLASRIAHRLDLHGEALNVQSACSSALVAVHMAAQSLLAGRADLCLAGATSLRVREIGYEHEPQLIASLDGHCRAFDRRANGMVEGDGAGAVVLKRLADARADGDRIHAVIRGTAVNNDGAARPAYAAPSVRGQAECVRSALDAAGVPAQEIGFVEAHGTATRLGDPIEVEALTRAFRNDTGDCGYCALGSIKANIGHLGFAAGMAGLIKAALGLERGVVPPSINFEEPNPEIDFPASPFFVNSEPIPWPDRGGLRRAGVSSFGMGGTNAHAVLEQAPATSRSPESGRYIPFLLSGRDPRAVEEARRRLAVWCRAEESVELADIAYTLACGRRSFEYRWIAWARDRDELIWRLEDPGAGPPIEVEIQPAGPDLGEAVAAVAAWQKGATFDWRPLLAGGGGRPTTLPTYPFAKTTHWLPGQAPPPQRSPRRLPLDNWFHRPGWRQAAPAGATGAAPEAHSEVSRALRENAEVELANGTRLIVLAAAGDGGDVPGRTAAAIRRATGIVAGAPDGSRVCFAVRRRDDRPPDPVAAALAALLRVGAQERPGLRASVIELEPDAPEGEAERLAVEIERGEEVHVVFREESRALPVDTPAPLPPAAPAPRPGEAWLITGGLGRIGLALARAITETGAKAVLISRSSPESAPAAATVSAARRRRLIEEMRGEGADLEVCRCDVTEGGELRAVVEDVVGRFGEIGGVVHAAGVDEATHFRFLTDTDGAMVDAVMAPKLEGLVQLSEALADVRVRMGVAFSSLSTTLGGLAFGSYAAANGAMDTFAGAPCGTEARWRIVNWDTWRFADPGAARIGSAASIDAIEPGEGVEVLWRILASDGERTIVSSLELGARRALAERALIRKGEPPRAAWSTAVEGGPREVILGLLRERFGLSQVPLEGNLVGIGCDSLALVDLAGRAEGELGVEIETSDLWGVETVGQLVALFEQHAEVGA